MKHLRALESEHLHDVLEVRSDIDELLEKALIEHETLANTIEKVLQCVGKRIGSTHLFVHTYGDKLALETFATPVHFVPSGEWLTVTQACQKETGSGHVLLEPLDVAGTWFGCVGASLGDADVARAAAYLAVLAEILDNYLYAIYAARQKQETLLQTAHALRHPVLGDGLANAVRALSKKIPVHDMLFVYHGEESTVAAVQIQHFRDGEPVSDAEQLADGKTLTQLATRYFDKGDRALLDHFGIGEANEEVLINGITQTTIVGKLVATSKKGSFNTYDKDLLASFAGFVRQRIVDFNKEWRTLARSFRDSDVLRLLRAEGYREKYLAPRNEMVGVLYADISGFTRISEQVLRSPERVAHLVEAWSREAVDLVWKECGVFDKMVGDCVIALFGPPFYDASEAERLSRAIAAARAIRDMTQAFSRRPGFEHLAEAGLDVSIGVHLTPLFVGLFGPNQNFTGFSSGMNNTARLQGCAKSGEVLVMDEAISAVSALPYKFGDIREAAVKNVKDPLKFRALVD